MNLNLVLIAFWEIKGDLNKLTAFSPALLSMREGGDSRLLMAHK